MNLQINFIDNNIVFEDGKVNVIEIENKEYFYRIVSELNNLQNGIDSNEITYFVSEEEKQLLNKLNVYIDYFNIDLNTRFEQRRLNNMCFGQSGSSNTSDGNLPLIRARNPMACINSSSVCSQSSPLM